MNHRELMPVAASSMALLVIALLPVVVGAGLHRPAGPLLSSTAPLLLGFEFRGAEISLPGQDGSEARLSSKLLRLEAADTGTMLSTTKAIVAREAVVFPVDRAFPRWNFERVQLRRQEGPFDWFGPAWFTTSRGEIPELLGPRGTFTIVDGVPSIELADR